jgi:hypothetical protein
MNRTMTFWPITLGLASLSLCPFALLSSTAAAAELGSRPVSWEPRVVLAKSLSPIGSLLVNEQPGQPWRALGLHGDIYSRDLLLALPGMQASLETSPRAVELTLWGNLPKWSEFSGLESAVILHDSRSFDLDFTLRHGRVLVANRKESGPARVWLRVEGAAFQLTLGEPGDTVCLGLNSFWPRGVPFSLSPRSHAEVGNEEGPVRTLNILAVKGQVDVKVSGVQHSLSAPPGLSFFHWDSVNGPDAAPRQRRQLEAWADRGRAPTSSEATRGYEKTIAKYQAAVKASDPRTALIDLLSHAAKEQDREQAKATVEFAVFGLAAINDIERVMQVLDDPNQAEARHAAVIALRHWIGNDAGRDRLLYQFLINRLNYTKTQAATVLQLLHDAYAADDPVTYETLIDYLGHPKLSIRELAWRHLLHLVPEDIIVPYDPAAAPTERAKACAAWKDAIPSGSLPTRKAKKK